MCKMIIKWSFPGDYQNRFTEISYFLGGARAISIKNKMVNSIVIGDITIQKYWKMFSKNNYATNLLKL